MPTTQANLPAFLSSDTDFRTWGSNISAALLFAGLVQTSDTGQINWTTVTRPGTTSTSAGYEIWRFADTLQSTAPVFIKVEYGTGISVDRTSMWITVGSSANGSGTIGGQVGTRRQITPFASKTAGVTLPCYVAGTSGRIAVAFNEDPTDNNYPCLWQVSRTADATGADTADGVFVALSSVGASQARQTIPASGAVPSMTTSTAWVQPDVGSTPQSATATPLSPAMLFAGGKQLFSINWMHYRAADIASGSPITVNAFGTTRTFMPLGSNQGASWVGSAVVVGVAMLWE